MRKQQGKIRVEINNGRGKFVEVYSGYNMSQAEKVRNNLRLQDARIHAFIVKEN